MINKNIEQITKDDLQALIDNEVSERKTIEYKQALPEGSDKDKREFLADVSSFANASGGDLIYGVAEDKKTGKPTLDGLDITNVDQEILRLDSIIRTGIQPRLPSVIISPPIPLDNSKVALIIRIPKSWISPHRVIPNDKFFSRSSNGKYPLDVGELRIAFNLSETIIERVRHFNLDRASKIYANETPIPFFYTAKIALHLIPINSFNPAQSYNINEIASNPREMPPINSHGWNSRYNLDGFLTYSEVESGKAYSYVQLFRSGIIEAVEGLILNFRSKELIIPSVAFEEKLIKSLEVYLPLLKKLNVELPIFVFLDLFGVKGYSMGIDTWKYEIGEVHTIDRDALLLPEIIVESYEVRADKLLRPCFDSIWNACGLARSLYYHEKGEWNPK